jgi:phosphate:Na+ symporter
MALMTSGLRKLAGDRLRHWLARSTKSPISGVVTGATVTALIQSSSATTVAAIGFVGAGLMSFPASLGIIFGANIGTTITGWMVAVLGFKLKLADAALPLLFVAAICYLFKRIRPLRGFGKALAGFCLIFIGISYLQGGLDGYRDVIDLSRWSVASFGGRIVLVLIGVILTLVTQSSSATVAAALTALSAGILDLPQTAAVIIGADIGTTGTAALATIGGSTAARRTGFAHVIYNLMTGVVAFFILPLYLGLIDRIWPDAATHSPEVVAVGFHSLFNILGVILVLPFTSPFGRLIERLFPEREAILSAPFDKKLLEEPNAALAALEFGCRQLAAVTLRRAGLVLFPSPEKKRSSEPDIEPELAAIEAGREFALAVGGGETGGAERVFACIHLLDHIERLIERTRDTERADSSRVNPGLVERARSVSELAEQLAKEILEEADPLEAAAGLMTAAAELEEDKLHFRQGMIRSATLEKGIPGKTLDDLLDAHRWLRRMTYHAGRIGHYAGLLSELSRRSGSTPS